MGDLAMFLGGFCFALALPLTLRFGQLNASLLLMRRERDELRADNLQLRDSVAAAASLASGFRKNFDSVLSDYKDEVRKRYARAEDLFAAAEERQQTVDALGKRFLKETVANLSSRLTANNFNASAERLRKTIEFCRKSRFEVPASQEHQLLEERGTSCFTTASASRWRT
ncbi:hypothetical protein PLANPX_4212 [Lacipirellula parvula]|uniref:Uncharacterized protein n=2 Tax=Lacipirellula parvula TaxID=2650471 RepID=A0A5K7XCP9_9BACT|nr:hypothetical protein PLANPX_4212 [Lacipirellula parvula]